MRFCPTSYQQKKCFAIVSTINHREIVIKSCAVSVLQVGDKGLEQPPKNTANTPLSETGGTNSGTVGAQSGTDAVDLMALVASLTEEQRTQLMKALALKAEVTS
jgi:hypothetical protein